MLKTIDLLKKYNGNVVNDNININIPKGSIFGLLGPNGAGKTTLIRMLSTITRPESGQILFNNEPLNSEHAKLMGYMPEERGLYKKMSVWEQILFFAEIKGLSSKEAKEKATYWLQKLEIADWKNKKLEELSKGMAQKVQFLCTIIHNPPFLILDEPFSGFDPVNADLVKDLILELNAQGTTILFSSHRMDNIEELCNNIAIIHHGKIVLEGTSSDIRKRFFKNNYILGFSKPIDITSAPLELEDIGTSNENYFLYKCNLENDSQKLEILQYAAKTGNITLFKEDLPTIHEIFVHTVNA